MDVSEFIELMQEESLETVSLLTEICDESIKTGHLNNGAHSLTQIRIIAQMIKDMSLMDKDVKSYKRTIRVGPYEQLKIQLTHFNGEK